MKKAVLLALSMLISSTAFTANEKINEQQVENISKIYAANHIMNCKRYDLVKKTNKMSYFLLGLARYDQKQQALYFKNLHDSSLKYTKDLGFKFRLAHGSNMSCKDIEQKFDKVHKDLANDIKVYLQKDYRNKS